MQRRKALMLIGAVPVALLSACAYGPGNGPPAHAPAWGRRRKMVWDPALGVHTVVGMPGVYYSAPYYYRLYKGTWHLSKDLDRWEPAHKRGIPPGLAKK